jgi:hypothetical protein
MSDLRDLARRIEEVRRAHPSGDAGREIVAHCCSMLDLLAGHQAAILAVAAFAAKGDYAEKP